MPAVKYLPADSVVARQEVAAKTEVKQAKIPATVREAAFYQDEKRGVSIDAEHFTKSINANGVYWNILPDHGRTGSAITPFPVTASEQKPGGDSPHLQYDIYTYSAGDFSINAYFSPSLNFIASENGLQYAISVDDDVPQIISLNKEDKTSDRGIWNKWVSESIIIKSSTHKIAAPGKHTVKFWMVNPGVVLQKLVVDFGGIEPSYLGPNATINR